MSADDWSTRALCAQADPESWFPEKGGSTREAKKVCASCEVRAECLEYALDNDERYGVWGGLSERERHQLARERGIQPRRERIAVERVRWAKLAVLHGVEVDDIANHLGVDERTVFRYTSEDAA